jgi:hypothetical protein
MHRVLTGKQGKWERASDKLDATIDRGTVSIFRIAGIDGGKSGDAAF